MRLGSTFAGLSWMVVLSLSGPACGSATRALVYADDQVKVFPWPASKEKEVIRVKPMTTMANACIWFGSYQEVEVTGDTTFFITDELDKRFAYTPNRSPIRRLSTVKSIEIRWPVKKAAASTPAVEVNPAEAKPEGKDGVKGTDEKEVPPGSASGSEGKSPGGEAGRPDGKTRKQDEKSGTKDQTRPEAGKKPKTGE